MIDIPQQHLKTIKNILKKNVPDFEVRLFGSRLKWTAKKYSDVDLAILGEGKIQNKIIFNLQDDFEESDLPYTVDILDWNRISPEFKKNIEKKYEVIQKGRSLKGWNNIKLQDITTKIGSGATPRGGSSSYHNKGISFIRSQNVLDFLFSNDGLVFISDEQAKKLNNVTVENNDILLNITGDSVARCCKVPDKIIPARVNQHVSIIRIDDKKSTSEFIQYYLLNPQTKNHLLSMSGSGATRKALTKGMIENLDITIPPLPEQKQIAKILSSIDDKIELNNRINKRLEELAQTIFKRWFIDFEFFDENGNPYKSSGGTMINSELGKIPSGWNILKLTQFGKIQMGVSPASKSYNTDSIGSPLLNGASDFENGIITPKKYTIEPKKMCKKGDFVFCIRATIGLLTIADKEYCLGRGVASFKSDEKEYVEYLMICIDNSFHQLISNASGSVFKNISKPDLENIKVLKPLESIINKFHLILKPIYKEKQKLKLENLNLKIIRDSLLPKLMSGEIRVPACMLTHAQVNLPDKINQNNKGLSAPKGRQK